MPRRASTPNTSTPSLSRPSRAQEGQLSAKDRVEARRARRAAQKARLEGKDVPSDTSSTARSSAGGTSKLRSIVAPVKAIIIAIVAVAVIFVLAVLILWNLPVFTINAIDAKATEHISSDAIANLADVKAGTTLVNVDISQVADNIKKNPWAAQVSVSREFPDKLSIRVTERKASTLVLMSSSDVAWYLGEDGVWIEPFNIATQGSTTAENAALQQASNLGCLLVTSVPSSVSPTAGSKATDASLLGVQEYLKNFSSDFTQQIVSFSAASTDSLTCTLSNGVEVSLGAPTDVDTKEQIITQLLAQHPNQITYINVRVPSNPTYRKVGVESVQSGSGGRVVDQTQPTTAAATDAATTAANNTGTTTTNSSGTTTTNGSTNG